jgi:hypothetical protein
MSTSLAIAATTAVIKNILSTGATNTQSSVPQLSILGTISVSALPLDRVLSSNNGPSNETSRLNLFMYQVSPNPGWRNMNLPSRDSRGDRVANQALALDLHYLLTAYGAEELHQEIMLGIGMQLMHEMPVLTRDAIRATFTPPSGGTLTPVLQALATSALADQIELIKICPQVLNTEELSKLWPAFQEKYRPTAAYTATVVLIESSSSVKSTLPVLKSNIYVMPLRQPVIDSVEPQQVALVAGATLDVLGRDLLAPDTVVSFGAGGEQAPDAAASTGTRLHVALPAAMLAGVNTVQVIQRLMIGEPALHRGFESNLAAFVIRPTIKKKVVGATEVYDITVSNPLGTPTSRTANVIVKFNHPIGQRQPVMLLMNELNPPSDRPARAYTFNAPSREADLNPTTDTITFNIKGVVSANYLVRVRVDGAESSLDVDASQAYVEPKMVI